MGAVGYLNQRGLHAEPLPGNQLSVWPAEKITSDVRVWIRKHKKELLHELLPANDDTRMAWRIVRNGKGITLLGRPLTYEQAFESAKARWPKDNITIEEYGA